MSSSDEHRLPRTVVPSQYRLTVDSWLDLATFHGVVEIDADVVSATSTIVMNSSGLDIGSCAVAQGGENVSCSFALDDEAERLSITTSEPVQPGPLEIVLHYDGTLDDSLSGYYISTFEIDGEKDQIGVTQFEAPYARRAFPCWDEPDFKATFAISLICDSSLLAVSNSTERSRTDLGEGRTRFEFEPTMVMSTYLVAWAIGNLEVSETVTVAGTPIRVLHRPGAGHLTDFALECGAHALEWFEEYYDVPYAGGKLDLIAVPDFAFGAMENNGCVTFRENLLLIDPKNVTSDELESAATVIEHEIAHMWFGNLVTMDWWDGIWLNEAFATLMEMSCADEFNPEGQIWTSFETMRSAAFDTDWLPSTRPIEIDVFGATDTEDMFDVLTYEKGAAVLRMFEQWVGPEKFRDAVRSYLKRHAYKNTSTSDLWAELSSATNLDASVILDEWIHRGGHPLVMIESTGLGVTLTQIQNHAIPNPEAIPEGIPMPAHAEDTTWQIPIRYRARFGTEVVDGTTLLGSDAVELPFKSTPDYFTANLDATGFYRTAGADEVSRGWLNKIGDMTVAERLYTLDTMSANVLGGRASVSELFDLISGISKIAISRQVWRRMKSSLGEIKGASAGTSGVALEGILRTVLLDDVSTRPTPPTKSEQNAIEAARFEMLANLGGCETPISHALEMLPAVIEGTTEFDSEMQSAILTVAAHNGGIREFDLIHRWITASPSPQEELRAIRALGAFSDPELADRFQQMCLNDMRSQNAGFALARSLGSHDRPIEVWRFIEANWEQLTASLPTSSVMRMVGGIRSIWRTDDANEIISFFDDKSEMKTRPPLQQHLQRMHVNVSARERIVAELAQISQQN